MNKINPFNLPIDKKLLIESNILFNREFNIYPEKEKIKTRVFNIIEKIKIKNRHYPNYEMIRLDAQKLDAKQSKKYFISILEEYSSVLKETEEIIEGGVETLLEYFQKLHLRAHNCEYKEYHKSDFDANKYEIDYKKSELNSFYEIYVNLNKHVNYAYGKDVSIEKKINKDLLEKFNALPGQAEKLKKYLFDQKLDVDASRIKMNYNPTDYVLFFQVLEDNEIIKKLKTPEDSLARIMNIFIIDSVKEKSIKTTYSKVHKKNYNQHQTYIYYLQYIPK